MRTVIGLPNGRQVGIGVYVKAYRELRKMDPDTRVKGFGYGSERAADILYAMRGMFSEVINRHDRSYGVGRKWDNDYQVRLWRDSRRLQDIAKRIRVYQFETEEARSRFSDRLSNRDE